MKIEKICSNCGKIILNPYRRKMCSTKCAHEMHNKQKIEWYKSSKGREYFNKKMSERYYQKISNMSEEERIEYRKRNTEACKRYIINLRTNHPEKYKDFLKRISEKNKTRNNIFNSKSFEERIRLGEQKAKIFLNQPFEKFLLNKKIKKMLFKQKGLYTL